MSEDPPGVDVCTPDSAPSKPPWRRTLYACWIAQVLSIVGFSCVMPFMPFYVRHLGVSGEAAVAFWSGLVITGAGLTQALFAPIWGALADRYGRKMMVQRSMFGGALVLTLMGLASNVHELFVLRMLQGALTGTVVASTTLVASITPNHRMGLSLGLMQVAVLTGMSVGPWAGGLVADHWGYRMAFYSAGVLLAIGGFIVLFGAKEQFKPAGAGGQNHGLRQAFGRKGLMALLVAFFMMSLTASFVGPIFPLLVESMSGPDRAASTAGFLMGIAGLAAGLSALGIGLLGDRVGHKLVLVGCTITSAIFAAPHALAQSIGHLIALRVGMGLARGGTMPSLNAIVGQAVSADTYGRSFGNTRIAGGLGMGIGPLLGGLAAAHYGLRMPFVIMSGLLLLNAIILWMWVRPAVAPAEAAEPAPENAGGEEPRAAT